ncbi:MAG: TIGR00297 family protein [Synechococcus sp. ELA057]
MPPLPAPTLLSWLIAAALHAPLLLLARRAPLLTPAGWRHAALLGTLLWGSLGWRGWLAVVLYLLLGSLVTRIGLKHKQAHGLAEGRGGRRGPENVWGSALVGALLALLIPVVGQQWRSPLLLAFCASFAAKLADTFGSEIGKRWGRHAILISTGRPVPPGTEGAISLEGTSASLLGSLLMTGAAALLGLISGPGAALLVATTGLVATLLESLIGATLQRRWSWLSNEMVNGLQTLIAAVLALLLTPLINL